MPDEYGRNTFNDWAPIAGAFDSINKMAEHQERRVIDAEKREEREKTQVFKQKFVTGELDAFRYEPKEAGKDALWAAQAQAAYIRDWKSTEEGKDFVKQNRFKKGKQEWDGLQLATKKMKHFKKKNPNVSLQAGVEWMNKSSNPYSAEIGKNGKAKVYFTERGEKQLVGEMGVDELLAEASKFDEQKYFQYYSANAEDTARNNLKSALNPKTITNGQDTLKAIRKYSNISTETKPGVFERESVYEFYTQQGELVAKTREDLIKEGYHFTTLKEERAKTKLKQEAVEEKRKKMMASIEFIGNSLRPISKEKKDEMLQAAKGGNIEPLKSEYEHILSIANGNGDEAEKNLAKTYIQYMAELFPAVAGKQQGAVKAQGGGDPNLSVTPEQDAILRQKMGQQPTTQPSGMNSADVRAINPGIDAAIDKYQDVPSWANQPAITPSGGNPGLDTAINQYHGSIPQNLLDDQEVSNQISMSTPQKKAIDDKFDMSNLITVSNTR